MTSRSARGVATAVPSSARGWPAQTLRPELGHAAVRSITRSAPVVLTGLLVLVGCNAGPTADASLETDSRDTYRQSRSEFVLAWAACLQEKGYRARVDDQGSGVMIDGATDPAKASADSRACIEAVDPARLQPPPPLTSDQLRELYRYVVAQTECMRQAGYPVSEPPPFQVYVDSDRAFDPYSDLRARGMDFDEGDRLRCQAVEERPRFLDE